MDYLTVLISRMHRQGQWVNDVNVTKKRVIIWIESELTY